MKPDTIISSKIPAIRAHSIIIIILIILAFGMTAPTYAQISIMPEYAEPPRLKRQIPYYEFLLNFESSLKERGFMKQNTLWDLVPPVGSGSQETCFKRKDYAQVARYLIGIWINYQDQLVMFRTNGDVLDEGQVVHFEQITEVRVNVDSYEETKARGSAGTNVRSYSRSSKSSSAPSVNASTSSSSRTVSQEIVKSAEVTIVTKSANGIQNYRIHVSNSTGPNLFITSQVHDVKNDRAIPFVQNIADEIEFIINEYQDK